MVLEKNYGTMCAEVLEILKYCPKRDIEKIPKKLIDSLEFNKSLNSNIVIDSNKGIFEQNVTNETILMMFIIFRNYWATEEEKKEIDRILIDNEIKYRELYSIDNLFEKQNKITQKSVSNYNLEKNVETAKSTSLVEYHENIITKLIKLIKKIFNK